MSITVCDPSAGIFRDQESYAHLRRKLITYFEGRRCWNADDLADESVARLIAYAADPDRPFDGNVNALAFGIARIVLKEWFRKSANFLGSGDSGELDSLPSPGFSPESGVDASRALGILAPAERELLEQYYVDGSSAARLSLRWGLSPAGVRSKVFRLRVRLLRYSARAQAAHKPLSHANEKV